MNAKRALKAAVFVSIIGTCGFSQAAILSPGDIVVASLGELPENTDGAIFKVDPVTGNRTMLSGPGVGSGPGFEAFGIALASAQDIYFTDNLSDSPAIYHVDVATGNRQVIASATVGTGPEIQLPGNLIVRDDGMLIVADAFGDQLVLINPTTLERTVLSGASTGNGPAFFRPISMTQEENGDLLVPMGQPSQLYRVDAASGDREVVSAIGKGDGPWPDLWSDVIVSDGQAVVTNFDGLSKNGLYTVDLATGNREVLSATGAGVGTTLVQPWSLGIEADGQLVVTNVVSLSGNSIVRIDPLTGDRTIISGSGVGSGPDIQIPQYLDIVPVPEPPATILFISGMLLLLSSRFLPSVGFRC